MGTAKDAGEEYKFEDAGTIKAAWIPVQLVRCGADPQLVKRSADCYALLVPALVTTFTEMCLRWMELSEGTACFALI